ncbi:hypothetical protein DBV15_04794 [Temnothorax longispinosus]|uniref:Uncharacterized protein n=1 Tax=Temnothorax longispinosus TaxID=300112 RepID=A0A4S2JNL3_9HYME|nr:hypothetical protein DBV15_04794 [Temnothorax longispinosus]
MLKNISGNKRLSSLAKYQDGLVSFKNEYNDLVGLYTGRRIQTGLTKGVKNMYNDASKVRRDRIPSFDRPAIRDSVKENLGAGNVDVRREVGSVAIDPEEEADRSSVPADWRLPGTSGVGYVYIVEGRKRRFVLDPPRDIRGCIYFRPSENNPGLLALFWHGWYHPVERECPNGGRFRIAKGLATYMPLVTGTTECTTLGEPFGGQSRRWRFDTGSQ